MIKNKMNTKLKKGIFFRSGSCRSDCSGYRSEYICDK